MEIIIALLVVAGLAFYLIRKNKEVEEELQQTEAAYKVEAPQPANIPMVVAGNPVMPTEVGKSADDRVESTAPVATEEIQWPKVEAAKQPAKRAPRAKKPAAPRAPAKPKAVPAKTAKPKAPAIKATPAKKPRAK
jgi:hypothetical protein